MTVEALSSTETPIACSAGWPVSISHGQPDDSADQHLWASLSVRDRLKVLRRARHLLAQNAESLAAAISPDLPRTPADTLVAEVLPLLEACRFLERRAQHILAPQRLGRRGLPFWLVGVDTEVRRVPFGHVLVIAPSNYPLLLPGVQTLQALAAGNAVTWKPGRGGAPVAQRCAQILYEAGVPCGLVTVTDDTVAAAEAALHTMPAKVIFTGSASTGRILLHRLAETATPSVMELSGCDAVLVLPSADFTRTVSALAFGMRLNGSATCMAPRRVLLIGFSPEQREQFVAQLLRRLADVPAVPLAVSVRQQLNHLLDDAKAHGAEILGESRTGDLKPMLVLQGSPQLLIAQADIFAPVLTVIEVSTAGEALAAQAACPLTLTASIFGDEQKARELASLLDAATVMVNDLIVPTADPRVPFGGRGASGFGVTRGAEGLLEMTQTKVIAVRRNHSTRHYDPTDARHAELFAGLIAASHGRRWPARWAGLRRTLQAAKRLRS